MGAVVALNARCRVCGKMHFVSHDAWRRKPRCLSCRGRLGPLDAPVPPRLARPKRARA